MKQEMKSLIEPWELNDEVRNGRRARWREYKKMGSGSERDGGQKDGNCECEDKRQVVLQ